MQYIAFMDLLGIKSIAVYSPSDYHKKITIFQKIIEEQSKIILNNQHTLIAFSDCAYLQSNDLLNLINFFNRLRQELNERDIFFNAAIQKGDLQINISNQDHERNQFIMFESKETVEVYSRQVKFTGIGINVDDVKNDKSIEHLIVKSCYNERSEKPEQQFKIYKEYYDIIYPKESCNIDYIFRKLVETFNLDKRASRYYLSGIITLIRSTKTIEELLEYEQTIFNKSILRYKNIYLICMPIQLVFFDQYLNLQTENYGIIDSNNYHNRIQDISSAFKKSVLYKKSAELGNIPNCILNNRNKLLFSKMLYDKYLT